MPQWLANSKDVEEFQAFRDREWSQRQKFTYAQWKQKTDQIQYWLWIDESPDKRKAFSFDVDWQ